MQIWMVVGQQIQLLNITIIPIKCLSKLLYYAPTVHAMDTVSCIIVWGQAKLSFVQGFYISEHKSSVFFHVHHIILTIIL